jgi:hypothetical protein
VKYKISVLVLSWLLLSAAAAADDNELLRPLQLSAFVDAYAAWQSNAPGTLATRSEHRAFSAQGADGRSENGLSLAWLGFNAEYDAGNYGVVANLRFGQAATLFHGDNDLSFGIDHLTQAYALYRPVPELELDLGMFISPFGYESLESWKNPNYTISALYTYGQPNWHMGFRSSWQVHDSLTLMGLVVNGINNISETQQNGGLSQRPTLGGAVSYRANAALAFSLGGMCALDPTRNDDEGYDVFGDFVTTFELGGLLVALNVDYIYTHADRQFIGASLTSGYKISDTFRIAARAEYLRDQASFDGPDTFHLFTGTFTFDMRPVPDRDYLIVRWENRVERSNQRIFGKSSRGTDTTDDDTYRRGWFESVIGVVVTTNP